SSAASPRSSGGPRRASSRSSSTPAGAAASRRRRPGWRMSAAASWWTSRRCCTRRAPGWSGSPCRSTPACSSSARSSPAGSRSARRSRRRCPTSWSSASRSRPGGCSARAPRRPAERPAGPRPGAAAGPAAALRQRRPRRPRPLAAQRPGRAGVRQPARRRAGRLGVRRRHRRAGRRAGRRACRRGAVPHRMRGDGADRRLPGDHRRQPGLAGHGAPSGLQPGGDGGDLLHRVVPEQLQPEATAFERAAAAGVAVTLVGPRQHAHSGMTRAVLRGGTYRPAFSLADLVAVTAQTLAEPGTQLVYAYHADLDLLGHIRGVDSDAWRLQLAEVDAALATLAGRLPAGALLVVTGDHGMVDLRHEDHVDVGDVPALLAGVRALGGEARARHVYTEPGATGEVLAAWRELLGDRMWVVEREEAIAGGWFGPSVPDRVRPRIGEVVAAAYGRVGVMQRAVDPAHSRMVGHHGSMTAREQLVPMIAVRTP